MAGYASYIPGVLYQFFRNPHSSEFAFSLFLQLPVSSELLSDLSKFIYDFYMRHLLKTNKTKNKKNPNNLHYKIPKYTLKWLKILVGIAQWSKTPTPALELRIAGFKSQIRRLFCASSGQITWLLGASVC